MDVPIKELLEHDIATILTAANDGMLDGTLEGKQNNLSLVEKQASALKAKLLFFLEHQKVAQADLAQLDHIEDH